MNTKKWLQKPYFPFFHFEERQHLQRKTLYIHILTNLFVQHCTTFFRCIWSKLFDICKFLNNNSTCHAKKAIFQPTLVHIDSRNSKSNRWIFLKFKTYIPRNIWNYIIKCTLRILELDQFCSCHAVGFNCKFPYWHQAISVT
jgi:hypothetical protein